MTAPKVICPDCGFEGHFPEEGAAEGVKPAGEGTFIPMGKDAEGHLWLKCPRCEVENSFSVSSGLMRIGSIVLWGAGLSALFALVRLWLFGH